MSAIVSTVSSTRGALPNGTPPTIIVYTTTFTTDAGSSTSSSGSSSSSNFGNQSQPTYIGPSSSTTSAGSASSFGPSATSATSGNGIEATSSGTGTSSSSTSTASNAAAANGANSNTPGATSPSTTGLIAGVAVLGVLLAIALGVILFLLMRRQRRKFPSNDGDAAAFNRSHDMTEMTDRSTTKGGAARGTYSNNEIEASLLAGAGARSAGTILDDKQANTKFSKLNQDINDWVLTHFRHMNPQSNSVDEEIMHGVRNQPHYQSLLHDSRGKYLVLRGIVADGLMDAFDSGEINGFGDVFGMKERFPTNVGAREKATWRASTVLLLERDVGFHERQSRAVEAITQRIDYVVSHVAGIEYSEKRQRQLTTIVQHAAELALDLSKQRMNFVLLHPNDDAFEPAVMEDVLQESRADHLRGYQVLSVVFPAVVRYGDENGEAFDRRNVISKALVLAAAEGDAI